MYKIALIGAAGKVGQPLSLLLKSHPFIQELRLHDNVGVIGVETDLSHIGTKTRVKGFSGRAELMNAVRNVDIIIVAAGAPITGSKCMKDLLVANADTIITIAKSVASEAPKALLAITSLNTERANTFTAELK